MSVFKHVFKLLLSVLMRPQGLLSGLYAPTCIPYYTTVYKILCSILN